MRSASPRPVRGRGLLRGLFAFAAGLCLLWTSIGCQSKSKPATGSTAPRKVKTPPSSKVAGSTDGGHAPAKPASKPRPALKPLWTSLSPGWAAIKKQVAGKDIGRLSGAIYGKDRVVRGIVRANCGAGVILQAIYEDEHGLHVTPGMALNFFGLKTGHDVHYTDGRFDVHVNFSEDSPQRLAGTVKIDYLQGAQAKTYADLTVDGPPLPMLLPPHLEGKGHLPLFASCFPNGTFQATTSDEHTLNGYLHSQDVRKKGAPMSTLLFGPGTGLRVFLIPGKSKSSFDVQTPVSLEEARHPSSGRKFAVLVDAFYIPEVAPPSEALGANLSKEKTVHVWKGTARFSLHPDHGGWRLHMQLDDVTIPLLMDGPLRGTTFKKIVIDARPTPNDEISAPPGPLPTGVQE